MLYCTIYVLMSVWDEQALAMWRPRGENDAIWRCEACLALCDTLDEGICPNCGAMEDNGF